MKKIFSGILKRHPGIDRFISSISWQLGEQLLRMLAGLFVGVWVARYLGPEEFGIFNYVLAFVAIFSTIAKLGLDGIVIRELVTAKHTKEQYMGTAFWLKAVAGTIISIVAIVVANSALQEPRIAFYISIVAAGIALQCFDVVDFYFQSKVLSKYVSICKIIQLSISSIIKIYLVLVDAELVYFVITTLVDQIMLGLTLFYAFKKHTTQGFVRTFNINIARQYIKDSWPLIFSSLVVMIYMRIDQIMIKSMLGNKNVGIYSAAVKLSEIWYFVPIILTNTFFPAIINAKKGGQKVFYSRLQDLFTLMVFIAIGLAIPITLASDWIVDTLYGKGYTEASNVLKIQIWAGIFVFLGVASSSWLISENLQRLSFYRTLLGALLNVILNLSLIPAYGIIGATYATLGAQVTAAFLFDAIHPATRQIFIMKLRAFNVLTLFIRET